MDSFVESGGIGAAVMRKEDLRFIVGAACYADDRKFDRQAYLAVLRSPHAHADIMSVDVTFAKDVPGVICVLTGADADKANLLPIPHSPWSMHPADIRFEVEAPSPVIPPHPVLATRRARYVGEPVACVVAESLQIAEMATEQIVVEWAPLPAIIDVRNDCPSRGAVWSSASDNTSLVSEVGDKTATDSAFEIAAFTVSLTTAIQRVTGSPMEPRSATGWYDEQSQRYTVYTSTGGTVRLRQDLAGILGVPAESLRVIAGDVGGNFGTRGGTYSEPVLVLWASKLSGRPIKWTGTRTECFLSDYQARDLSVTAELALDRKGIFLGLRGHATSNLGAYPVSFATLQKSVAVMSSIYHVPHAHFDVRAVFTNTPPTRPYRATGRPEAMFVIERLIDLAAHESGIDRILLRKRNLVTQAMHPYTNPLGTTYDNGDFLGSLNKALALGDWDGHGHRRLEASKRGKRLGIGTSVYIDTGTGVMRERAEIRVRSEGTVDILIGTVSNGQGHETSFAQLVTEWLGISVECVRLVAGDTDSVSIGGGSHSGRSMRLGAVVIRRAADMIVERGLAIASHMFEASKHDIEFMNGRFTLKGTDRSITLFEVASAAESENTMPDELRGPLSATSDEAVAPPSFPYGGQVCELEVDTDTGQVEIKRYVAIDDVGRAVNPMIVHGQTHGGIAQGVGQALLEKCEYDAETGQLYSATFMDYAMPRASDLPSFVTEITEVPSASHPLGMRSGGEGGTAPALAVVINAIVDALKDDGVRHLEMPATPYRIWRAIQDAKSPTGTY